jgi:hypothetical protein
MPGAAEPPVAPKDRAGRHVIKEEQSVEYRDQKGRIIPADKAMEMKGKVKFQVRQLKSHTVTEHRY